MEQRGTKKQIFLIFYIALFVLVAWMFFPYLEPILWACLIYSFTKPLFERCLARLNKAREEGKKRRGFPKSLLAGTFAILSTLLIAVPIGFLVFILVRQILDASGSTIREIEARPELFSLAPDSPIGGFIYRLSQGAIDLSNVDLVDGIKNFLSSSANKIISYSGSAIKNVASLIKNAAFMLFTLFFLYLDGKKLMDLLISAIPLEKDITTMFLKKVKESSHQMVSGYLLVALYQGVTMFLISLAFGLKNNLVIGTLTAVSSFVPMVGTSLVWLPLSVYIAINQSLVRGIVFFVVSAVPVSVMDNFLRSKVLGDKLSIHPLLTFFSILGGIKLFGFSGMLLGPMILIVFLSAISIYDAFDDEKKSKEAKPGQAATVGMDSATARRRRRASARQGFRNASDLYHLRSASRSRGARPGSRPASSE